MTLNQIIQLFKSIGDSFYFINTTEFGDVPEFVDSTEDAVIYPAFYQVLEDTTTLTNTLERTFKLIVCDLVDPGKSNINEVLSDTEQTLNSIIKILRQESPYYTLVNDPQLRPFKDRYGDGVAGWEVDVVIETLYNDGFCDIPSDIYGFDGVTGTNGIPIAQFGCEDLSECETIQSIQDDITQLFNDIANLPSPTYSNGITYSNGNVRLGGELDSNTTLSGNVTFNIGDASSPLTSLSLAANYIRLPLDKNYIYAGLNSYATMKFTDDSSLTQIDQDAYAEDINGNYSENYLKLRSSVDLLSSFAELYSDFYNGTVSNTLSFKLNSISGDATFTIPGSVNVNGNSVELQSNKGIANGYAPLNSSTKIDSIYLPSYVDDVEEYASESAFPVTGESGKIYVALDVNKIFRWSGSAYIEISASAFTGAITTNQVAYATTTNTIGGTNNLTFDGDSLRINGTFSMNVSPSATLHAKGIGSNYGYAFYLEGASGNHILSAFNIGQINIGTSGAQQSYFDNNLLRIGGAPGSNAGVLTAKGVDSNNWNYAFSVYDGSGNQLFNVRNDKKIFIGTNPSNWDSYAAIDASGIGSYLRLPSFGVLVEDLIYGSWSLRSMGSAGSSSLNFIHNGVGEAVTINDIGIGVGLNNAQPEAVLHLKRSTNGYFPSIKIASGTLLYTTQAGAIEYDGNYFYGTTASLNRYAFTQNDSNFDSGRVSFVSTAGVLTTTSSFSFDATSQSLKVGTVASPFTGEFDTSKNKSADGVRFTAFNSAANGWAGFYMGQSISQYAGWARGNSSVSGNLTGTSIPYANLAYFQNHTSGSFTGPISFSGTPLYFTIGTSGTNKGARLDATGFRIDNINTLHTANSTQFAVGSTLTYDGTSLKIGSASQTSTFTQDLIVAKSSGNSGIGLFNSNTAGNSIIYFGESNNKLAYLNKHGSTVATSYTGTSIATADTVHLSNTINGNYGSGKVITSGSDIINIVGQTSTNYGTKLDSAGFRIGQISGLHTANTNIFEAGVLSVSSTGIVSIATHGQTELQFTGSGVANIYHGGSGGAMTIGLPSGTIHFTANAYASYALTIGANSLTLASAILNLAASSTSRASMNIPTGVAPTTPANGDIWFDGTDLKIRIAGVTKTFTLT